MKIEEEINQKQFRDVYEKVMVNVLFTGSWLQNYNNQFLKDYDLTVQQYNVLRILRGQSPEKIMLNEIQSRMLDRMSNASRLVDKLKNKQLVERKACKHDRRKVDIWITPLGLEVLEKIDAKMADFYEIFYQLTEEESETISHLLDKLRG
jgi:DNA-binding MarR family transcriptional regulator